MKKDFILYISTQLYCKEPSYNARLSFISGNSSDIKFKLWSFFILENVKQIIDSIKNRQEVSIIEYMGMLFVKPVSTQETKRWSIHFEEHCKNEFYTEKYLDTKIFNGKIKCFGINTCGLNIKISDSTTLKAGCLDNSNFITQSYCIIESFIYDKKVSIEFNNITKEITSIKHIEEINLNNNPYLSNLKLFDPSDFCVAYVKTEKINCWCVFPIYYKGFDVWDNVIYLKYNIRVENEMADEYYEKLVINIKASSIELKHTVINFSQKTKVKQLLPKYYIDFTNKTCSYIKHKFGLNNKKSWKEQNINFYTLIPEKDRYWIVNGVDYTEEFQKNE